MTSQQRISLISLDPPHVAVIAQFNPAQLQLEESASWTPSSNSRADHPSLEYASTSPRTLSLELLFDTFEEPVGKRNVKTRFVEPLGQLLQVLEPRGQHNVKTRFVEPLGRLLRVLDPDGDEDRQRPPLVELRWDPGLPRFRGVLESMSTKLTMFLADGTPVRATCSLKLLEASRASFTRKGR